MIQSIITFSIKNKFIVLLFVLFLSGWGIYSLTSLPIDAIPDITNNQVQIISLAPSLAVQEVEGFITAPLEMAVANIPDIVELRSVSRLGLSVVTVVFGENVDVYWARQQLGEKIKEAEEMIPPGLAQISLAPVSTGLGEIFQYRLVVKKGYEKKYNPMELRTLQDWVVRREMLGTPGVADINSYGGFVKQYEVAVHPERLKGLGLSLTDIFSALERNNENTGSAYIDKNPTAWFIRGIGMVKTTEDIEKIVVKTTTSGMPVLIRDVAAVQFGSAIRYGSFVVDTAEAVGGVVMMLKGANAHEVIDDVESRIAVIQKSLPEEVRIEPFLNRSDLVGRAIGTVSKNLIEGALIVVFILVLLLGNMRAGLIVASVIPLSMLFAISVMKLAGVSGNLMSLGAIDFGLIVDGAVIIVENVVHKLSAAKSSGHAEDSRREISGSTGENNGKGEIASIPRLSPDRSGPFSGGDHTGTAEEKLSREKMDETVGSAARRMMSSATFGQIIILVVYLPVIALVGIEGKMFRPMAQVVIFALLGAAILSLTWVPMASALFLSRKTTVKSNFSDKFLHWLQKSFDPVILFSLKHKWLVIFSALLLFISSIFLFNRLGGEFIPQLEEGDLAAGVMTLQGGSMNNTIDKVITANKILLENFPEVKHAVCKIGAGEIPTDPTPMETGDYIITLKDKSEWVSASTREELMGKMEEKLIALAGVKFEFQQPIQMRFNELMSGSKQDVAIKIFGDDLATLAAKGTEVEQLIRDIPGVEDINVEKVTGLAQIQVEYNRDRLAQYGLSVAEVNMVLKTAFAGSQAGVVFEEEKRFGLVVRLDKDYRQNLDDVKNLVVTSPNGNQIPLYEIAEIAVRSGPAQVSRENTQRRITVGFNVRNRDTQSVIREVTNLIDENLTLPTGYYISYGGEFKNLEAANKRLSVAVPVAILLIMVLLYFTFHSVKQSLLIFSAVPLSAIGGIIALWIRDMHFSISAGVGFIALFGVAVLNGIVLIAEFNRLEKDGITDINERVIKGLRFRLRPVVITAAVASLGFLPMALSTSAGAEVQKPLATVVIGGLISATLLTLIILPVFYILLYSGKKNMKSGIFRPGRPALFLLFFIPLCISGKSNAQTPRTMVLSEIIRTALDSNLSLKSASLSLKMAETMKGSALELPKTNVDGQYGQFNSWLKDNSFTISQSFALPSVYINRYRLANAVVRSREWELKSAQLETATQVKQIYWNCVYLMEKLKLLKYQDSLYSRFARAATLKANQGETNRLEMITARSHSLEVKNQLFQTNADIVIYSRKLAQLMNSRDPVLPSGNALKYGGAVVRDSLNLLNNPALGLIRQQVEVTGLEKKVEKNQMLPDLNVGYFNQSIRGIQEINGSLRETGIGDRFTGVQAGIAIPLWFVPHNAKYQAARIREEIARQDLENYAFSLNTGYQNLLDEYNKFTASIRFFEDQALPEAGMIIDQAERSYKAGALDYLDFVTSLHRALTIREQYLDALNDLNQTVISIEYLVGKIF